MAKVAHRNEEVRGREGEGESRRMGDRVN